MAPVIELATHVPNANVIAKLEEALERAKKGDLIAVAIVGQTRYEGSFDATFSSYNTGDGTFAHLVLALERCKMRILLGG